MQSRFVPVLFFCFLSAIVCTPCGTASAVQPALQALASPGIQQPLLIRTDGGCGWDYPCPPDPGFGRPLYLRGGEVVIHNNYGPVNVYPGDGAREGGDRAESRECYVSPCEGCGPLCWLRRFRHGYCGHGCLAYQEQAETEAEAREEDAERERERHAEAPLCEERFECRGECPEPRCRRGFALPPLPPPAYYYRRPQRAYAPPRREERPPRVETPYNESGQGEPVPRERFEGPRYPRE
jgi:hypothetical protein